MSNGSSARGGDYLGEILSETRDFLARFVILNEDEATAITLWVAHTWALGAAEATPYLHIRSAEKRSGKTRLLEVLELLVRDPLPTANISDAALFRAIAGPVRKDPPEEPPTLLFDEVDAVFGNRARDREDLRGMLNAGYRRGAVVYRMGGKTMTELESFPVFGAKALAGIGALPDTLADRTIRIALKRKTRDEPVQRFRRRDADADAEPISRNLESWADENLSALVAARPNLPPEIDDRAQDVWEPLLAIADLAGGAWPDRARNAANALSGSRMADDESNGVRLLADIRAIFEKGMGRIASVPLALELAEIEESPWGEWYGKPISARGIAKLLAHFEIRPRTVRLEDGTTAKGYLREQFEDAFSRYLPPENVIPSQPASLSEKQAKTIRHTSELVTDENGPFLAPIEACDGVTDRSAHSEQEGEDPGAEVADSCPVCNSTDIGPISGNCHKCGARVTAPDEGVYGEAAAR